MCTEYLCIKHEIHSLHEMPVDGQAHVLTLRWSDDDEAIPGTGFARP